MVPAAVSRVRALLAARLGADPRSLAAFRIGLALAVLADLAVRAGDLRAHYTDAGVLSRADALVLYDFLHAWPLCVHLAGGSVWSQVLLFSLAAMAASAMLVGWRTRLATGIAWLLTASVQLRDPYVGAGYDALLRMLLLWGFFLPLGTRWAMDADDPAPAGPPIVSVASVALLAQMVIVYESAGWTKWQVPAWHDGSALGWILADDFRVTALGLRLGGWPEVVRALGRAVPWVELVAPVVLVVSGGWLRATAAAALCALNLAFGLCLEVGLFPWVASAGLIGLLPARVWRGMPGDAAARAGGRSPVRALSEVVAAVVLAWVVWWSVGVARSPVFRAPAEVEWLGAALFLQQDWRMFSEPPSRTGWVVIPGRLADGTDVDLFSAGGPPPRAKAPVAWEKPSVPSRTFRNDRWRALVARGVYGTRDDRRLLNWGRYLCREWNAAHAGPDQLQAFEIVFLQRRIDDGTTSYAREVVWTHRCFG
jgi:hypothetical protein